MAQGYMMVIINFFTCGVVLHGYVNHRQIYKNATILSRRVCWSVKVFPSIKIALISRSSNCVFSKTIISVM